MAFTVNQTTPARYDSPAAWKYRYIDEPYVVDMITDNSSVSRFTIDIKVYSYQKEFQYTLSNFVELFADSDGNLKKFDIMKVLKQLIPSQKYEISNWTHIVSEGNQHTTTPEIYQLIVSESTGTLGTETISVIPLLGGRDFSEISDSNLTDLTGDEVILDPWVALGSTQPYFIGTFRYTTTLQPVNGTHTRPVIDREIVNSGRCADGGVITWKSRFGGFMTYGFDMKEEVVDSNYSGSVYEDPYTISEYSGTPASVVRANYISRKIIKTITLKTANVSVTDLKALQDLKYSPAVYYAFSSETIDSPDGYELMKVISVSPPASNLANGGPISVTLQAVATNTQSAR